MSEKKFEKQQALLLSSSGYKDTGYLTHALKRIEDFLVSTGVKDKEILFIPYAGVRRVDEAYEKRVQDALSSLNIKITSIHRVKDHKKAVLEASSILVGGGNTFKLVHDMYKYDIIEAVKEKVANGMPYIGWSAGANIAGKTMMTTNDMPIIFPKSFETLGFFPYQINPHFISGKISGHNGESREERLEEYLLLNKEEIICALPEGSAILIDGVKAKILGENDILVFKYNKEVELVKPNVFFKYD
ncbi:MAG: dipeptidase PepE [Campylobacteraceae bacterium]